MAQRRRGRSEDRHACHWHTCLSVHFSGVSLACMSVSSCPRFVPAFPAPYQLFLKKTLHWYDELMVHYKMPNRHAWLCARRPRHNTMSTGADIFADTKHVYNYHSFKWHMYTSITDNIWKQTIGSFSFLKNTRLVWIVKLGPKWIWSE